MGSIGAPELLVIMVIALLVLGPERLPEVARQVGKAVGEVRRMSSGFQAEFRDAIKVPVDGSPGSTPTGSTNGTAQSRFLWSDLPSSNEPPSTGGPSEPPS